jgi:hypothetical protein
MECKNVTGLYPDPIESSLHNRTLCFFDPLQYHPFIYIYISILLLFLEH